MNEKIIAIIKEIKNGHVVDEKDHLVFDGILSSLDMLALICQLEETFSIKIPIESILPDNFDTIVSIATLVKELQVK